MGYKHIYIGIKVRNIKVFKKAGRNYKQLVHKISTSCPQNVEKCIMESTYAQKVEIEAVSSYYNVIEIISTFDMDK